MSFGKCSVQNPPWPLLTHDNYGSSDEERLKVLDRAWELGCTNWDSADLYGDSEDLLGKWFALHPERRADIFLATKFGLHFGTREDGTRGLVINSSPEYCRQQCENSLKRLGVDHIDLYYIHRVDHKTPIEKTMAELVKLKQCVTQRSSRLPARRSTNRSITAKGRSTISASQHHLPTPSAVPAPSTA